MRIERSRNGQQDQASNPDAHQEAILRRSLQDLAGRLPAPPAGLPVSLLRAVRQEATPGVIKATLSLIRAQWPIVVQSRLVPAIVIGLALVFWTAGGLVNDFDLLVLAGCLPVAAGLFTVLLSGAWSDAAHALVSTTRTPHGAIVFARTTVALSVLVGVSTVGSLALALVTDTPFSALLTAWLGPTVIIGALATLLAQLWHPLLTVTVTLAAWTGLIVLAALELNGLLDPSISLRALLRPGSTHLVAQLVLAIGLVVAAWSAGLRSGFAGRHP